MEPGFRLNNPTIQICGLYSQVGNILALLSCVTDAVYIWIEMLFDSNIYGSLGSSSFRSADINYWIYVYEYFLDVRIISHYHKNVFYFWEHQKYLYLLNFKCGTTRLSLESELRNPKLNKWQLWKYLSKFEKLERKKITIHSYHQLISNPTWRKWYITEITSRTVRRWLVDVVRLTRNLQ